MCGHECNGLGCGEGGGANQIGLILPTRIVGDNNESAEGDIGYNFLDGTELECGHGLLPLIKDSIEYILLVGLLQISRKKRYRSK